MPVSLDLREIETTVEATGRLVDRIHGYEPGRGVLTGRGRVPDGVDQEITAESFTLVAGVPRVVVDRYQVR